MNNIKNKSTQIFIKDLHIQCKKNNVKIKLIESKQIMIQDLPCNGYFEGDIGKGNLVVAIKKPLKKWLPILVHESCHLDQWIENPELFQNLDGVEIIDEWIAGRDFKLSEIKKAIKCSRDLELDCEKRSVDKIIKYKLPIDIDSYIKMSNTYVYFYNWVLANRKWFAKGKTLYIEEIYKHASNKFGSNYNGVPVKLNAAFNKYLL